MLEDQPTFAEIADDVVELLHGRTLVAHNVAFDYDFRPRRRSSPGPLAAGRRVMCTVELARRLNLGLANLRLETLARHWNIEQRQAHDAFDDALVLSRLLVPALQRTRSRCITFRSVRRRGDAGRTDGSPTMSCAH